MVLHQAKALPNLAHFAHARMAAAAILLLGPLEEASTRSECTTLDLDLAALSFEGDCMLVSTLRQGM